MEILSIPLVSHTFNISQKFSLCYYPFDNQEHICIQNFVSSVIFSSVLHSLSPQISKLPSSTTPTLTLIQMETVFSSTVIYNVISINVQPKDKTLQTQRENRLNFFFFFFFLFRPCHSVCGILVLPTHFSILVWRIPWTEELESYSPWGHKTWTPLSDQMTMMTRD